MRPSILLLLALTFVACGKKTATGPGSAGNRPGATSNSPVGPALALTIEAPEGAVPGRPPPLRITGNAAGLPIVVRKAADPTALLPFLLDPTSLPPADALPEVVYRGTVGDHDSLSLPPFPTGLYVAEVGKGKRAARVLLSVSNLALVVKRSPAEILVFVADADTGRAVPGVPVSLLGAAGKRTDAADATGVFRATFDPGPIAAIVAGDTDRIAIARAEEWFGPEPATNGWIAFDRSATRPGSSVRFAALLFKKDAGRWRITDPKDARFVARDALGRIVAEGGTGKSAPGFLTGELHLPESAAPGPLTVEVGDAENRTAGDVLVFPAEEPTISLNASIPPKVIQKAPITLRLSGKYAPGAPAAGATVDYRIGLRGRAGAPLPRPAFVGHGKLDATGHLSVRFTPDEPGDWFAECQAADPPGKSVRAETSFVVRGSGIDLLVEPAHRFLPAGRPVSVRVKIDGASRLSAKVTVRLGKAERTFETGPDGTASAEVVFPSPGPGDFELRAGAMDARGRETVARSRVRILGAHPAAPAGRLVVIPEHDEAVEGSTVRFLVLAPFRLEGASLLETVEGFELGSHSVVPVKPEQIVPVKVPSSGTRALTFFAAAVYHRKVYEARATVRIRPSHRLDVRVTGPKTVPAGTAVGVEIATRDEKGRPASAQAIVRVSMADAPGTAPPDIESVLAGPCFDEVTTTSSLGGVFAGGTEGPPATLASTGNTPAGGSAFSGVRTAHPAFLRAGVTIPPGGRKLSIPLPDRPGRYRVVVTAVAFDGAAGTGRASFEARGHLAVTLAFPPRLVAEDVFDLPIRARKGDEKATKGTLSFETDGLAVVALPKKTLSFPEGEDRAETRATVSAPAAGPAAARVVLTAGGETAVATGSGRIVARARTRIVRVTGHTVAGALTEALEVPSGSVSSGSRLEIVLTAGPVAAAVRAAVAESGNTPQDPADVIGSLLPGALARARLEALGARIPKGIEDVPARTLDLLARLASLAGPDGGFGHAAGGGSDLRVTARVVSGLLLLERARRGSKTLPAGGIGTGTDPEAPLLARATAFLEKKLASGLPDADPNGAALAVAALAKAGKPVGRIPDTLYDRRVQLSDEALAELASTFVRLGRLLKGAALVDDLAKHEERDSSGASCWGGSGPDARRGDQVLSTAAALSAFVAISGKKELALARRAGRFLLDARQGPTWSSARRAGAAAVALLRLPEAASLPADKRVPLRVRVGPSLAAAVRVSVRDLAASGAVVTAPPLVVVPGRLRIDVRNGGPPLDESTLLVARIPSRELPAESEGLTVSRDVLRIQTGKKGVVLSDASPGVSRGALFVTTVAVQSERARKRVRITCPLSAGAVPDPRDVSGLPGLTKLPPGTIVSREPDRVVFFVPLLPAGETRLSFASRAVRSGRFTALPVKASLVDFPSIRGSSAPAVLSVN